MGYRGLVPLSEWMAVVSRQEGRSRLRGAERCVGSGRGCCRSGAKKPGNLRRMTGIRKRPRKVLPAMLRPPSISERFTTVLVTLADVPRWYHIYSTESYRANDALTFSHGWGDTRFSPITDAADEIVDTYYLASTVEGAFMESILHDVPIPGGILRTSKLAYYHLTEIELTGALTAVSFHSNYLEKMGLSRVGLIECLPDQYARTRLWAQAAYRQVTSAQAIAYGSRRDDSARCLMLFRQRMSAVPFRVISDDCVADAPARRQSIIALAASLGLHVI